MSAANPKSVLCDTNPRRGLTTPAGVSRLYLTDKEVACVFEIHTDTLRRILAGYIRGGERRATLAVKHRRIVDAEPENIGGFRRWRVDKLAAALGISEQMIIDRIS